MKFNYSIFCSLFLVTAAFCSCADKYCIKGDSIGSLLDGHTVFLSRMDNGVAVTIDSCQALHGNFSMTGNVDSSSVAVLRMGEFQLPVVLEPGEIHVKSSNMAIKIEGTPMNELLYSFLNSRDSLIMLLSELPMRESKMILEGEDHDWILRQLAEEESELRGSLDKLETDFITENYDNVLGVSWFIQLLDDAYRRFGYATTTPQIDEIYGRAPENFRNNPEVRRYMEQCK